MKPTLKVSEQTWLSQEEYKKGGYGAFDTNDDVYEQVEIRTRQSIINCVNNQILFFYNGTIALGYEDETVSIPDEPLTKTTQFLNVNGILKPNPNWRIDGIQQIDEGKYLNEYQQKKLKLAQATYINAQATGWNPYFESRRSITTTNGGQTTNTIGTFQYVDEFDQLPKETKMHLRGMMLSRTLQDPSFKAHIDPEWFITKDIFEQLVNEVKDLENDLDNKVDISRDAGNKNGLVVNLGSVLTLQVQEGSGIDRNLVQLLIDEDTFQIQSQQNGNEEFWTIEDGSEDKIARIKDIQGGSAQFGDGKSTTEQATIAEDIVSVEDVRLQGEIDTAISNATTALNNKVDSQVADGDDLATIENIGNTIEITVEDNTNISTVQLTPNSIILSDTATGIYSTEDNNTTQIARKQDLTPIINDVNNKVDKEVQDGTNFSDILSVGNAMQFTVQDGVSKITNIKLTPDFIVLNDSTTGNYSTSALLNNPNQIMRRQNITPLIQDIDQNSNDIDQNELNIQGISNRTSALEDTLEVLAFKGVKDSDNPGANLPVGDYAINWSGYTEDAGNIYEPVALGRNDDFGNEYQGLQLKPTFTLDADFITAPFKVEIRLGNVSGSDNLIYVVRQYQTLQDMIDDTNGVETTKSFGISGQDDNEDLTFSGALELDASDGKFWLAFNRNEGNGIGGQSFIKAGTTYTFRTPRGTAVVGTNSGDVVDDSATRPADGINPKLVQVQANTDNIIMNTNDIVSNTALASDNQSDILALDNRVGTNETNISTNTTDILGKVDKELVSGDKSTAISNLGAISLSTINNISGDSSAISINETNVTFILSENGALEFFTTDAGDNQIARQKDISGETVLFDNASNTDLTITLSESLKNFREVAFIIKNPDSGATLTIQNFSTSLIEGGYILPFDDANYSATVDSFTQLTASDTKRTIIKVIGIGRK